MLSFSILQLLSSIALWLNEETRSSRGSSRTAVLGIVKQRDIAVALAFQRIDEAVIVGPRVDMQARGALSVFGQVQDSVDRVLRVHEGRVFGIHDNPIGLSELAEFCFFLSAQQFVILDR